jgi:branched-chain amino acid transport system substrate-binding protein
MRLSRWNSLLNVNVLLGALLCFSLSARAQNNPVYVGLDAEFGNLTSTSAVAIRRGILIAIEEINQAGGVLNGRPLALLERDNRSVPARSIENIKELAGNSDVVAIFCGKFSPIALAILPTIHNLGIPLLNPWAAGDDIVDNNYRPNYVFRLSLRDSWAILAMMQLAQQKGTYRVGLLLPKTSWGRSSQKAAEGYVANHPKFKIAGTQLYNSGDQSLFEEYQVLHKSGAQAIILVASEREGSIFVRDMAALPALERLPIISHWGITGGDFAALAGPALHQVDLSVAQTYSFIEANNPKAKQVLAAAKRLFNVENAKNLPAPAGLAHAYDLTHILAVAINKAGSTDRKAIRNALEQVENYQGLIKAYRQPFTATRHEALSPADVFMAKFAADNTVVRMSAHGAE